MASSEEPFGSLAPHQPEEVERCPLGGDVGGGAGAGAERAGEQLDLAPDLIRFIMALKLFDLVYALTAGGPGFDTTVASFHIYRVALEKFNVGYAAALTLIFGVVVSLVTLPLVWLRDWSLRRWG